MKNPNKKKLYTISFPFKILTWDYLTKFIQPVLNIKNSFNSNSIPTGFSQKKKKKKKFNTHGIIATSSENQIWQFHYFAYEVVQISNFGFTAEPDCKKR